MTTTRYQSSDERSPSIDNPKFDFVVACGLAELAMDGRPASGSGSASKELTMEYTKTQAVEKMGRDTCKQPGRT
jgi:hypothetical protein